MQTLNSLPVMNHPIQNTHVFMLMICMPSLIFLSFSASICFTSTKVQAMYAKPRYCAIRLA